MKKILLLLLLITMIGTGVTISLYTKDVEGQSQKSTKVPFSISKGSSVTTIATRLAEKNIIPRAWTYRIYLKETQQEDILQAGDFLLHRGLSYAEITTSLSHAQPQEIPFRIPEGIHLKDLDALMATKGLIQTGDLLDTIKNESFDFNFLSDGKIQEGFLSPDTYYVRPKNFQVKTFLNRVLQNFENKYLKIFNEQKEQTYSLYEYVIMASIIEKEEFNSANMAMIAGVLWKREQEGIPLGADATTRYFENKPTEALFTADFQKDNRFNTRKYKGLPPHAIGTPGIAAFTAAVFPKDSPYYYYLHDNDGIIRFSETNAQHNQKKNKYLY
ncbi:hypothetical protein COB57_02135 [Candidatus Peregrinibacteria bacterium]|nr:MAG: hypothetical protein COB57_02135 [Candidatus Peregrinibacteria bacterium]